MPRGETPFPLRRPDIAEFLESIYAECNRKGRLERDPLAIVVRYEDVSDREVAGLLCSTLAFGSVDLILGACRRVLEPLGPHPAALLETMSDEDLRRFLGSFPLQVLLSRGHDRPSPVHQGGAARPRVS